MKAYSNGINKKKFVAEMKKHQKADAFIRGTYGDNTKSDFKGCSVGCALKSVANIKKIKIDTNSHINFEKYLGIPQWLARLNDTMFENVSNDRIKTWPVEFSEAINEGSNLDEIKVSFIVYILEQNLETLNGLKIDPKQLDIINVIESVKVVTRQMTDAQKSKDVNLIVAVELVAELAAWSVVESVESAKSVAWSSAARSAWLVVEAAARSAWLVARSSVESAVISAAKTVTYDKYADKLLELIRACV